MKYSLSMTENQHQTIKRALIHPDGLERVVWALCGKAESQGVTRYMIHSISPLPADAYIQNKKDRVIWKTEFVIPLIEAAEKSNLALLKIHNHPKGFENFSDVDDISDREISSVISDWSDAGLDFISCIITTEGKVVGRTVDHDGASNILSHVMVVGSDLVIFEKWENVVPTFAERNIQAFGEKTYRVMRNICVGVVGCSGTGSQIIEQLVRLGVGKIVLVDFDIMEEKNLNRITNTTMQDAIDGRRKVDALKEKILDLGLGTEVVSIPCNIQTVEAVTELSVCDIVFGCLDTKGGRHTLNRLASYYLQPYFDVGVRLDADGQGGVDGVHASINYTTPGCKSLIHRGIFTMEDIRAENKYFEDPEGYAEELGRGYVKGVDVGRPAVIPVNAMAAGIAVLDLLSRLHDFRSIPNDEIDKILISISGEILSYEEVSEVENDIFVKVVGRGNCDPLLGMPSITKGAPDEIS